tara:strand:+ start:65 stop:673 length:609 start_codon:yes stop_codon:yes gene_type:complete
MARKSKGKAKGKAKGKGKHTKKKGGVYQMGGAAGWGTGTTYTAQVGTGTNGGQIKVSPSGGAVGGIFTEIDNYLIAAYGKGGDTSLYSLNTPKLTELKNIINSTSVVASKVRQKADNSTFANKFEDLLLNTNKGAILTFLHTDNTALLSLERNNDEDFIAIKIKAGADSNSGKTQDQHIDKPGSASEFSIYVIELNKTPTFK